MAEGIGAAAAPMSAIGTLLSRQTQQATEPDAQLRALAQRVRPVLSGLNDLAQEFPSLAQDLAAMRQQLQQMVVKEAQLMNAQTASSAAVPGGGMA